MEILVTNKTVALPNHLLIIALTVGMDMTQSQVWQFVLFVVLTTTIKSEQRRVRRVENMGACATCQKILQCDIFDKLQEFIVRCDKQVQVEITRCGHHKEWR